LQARLQSKDDLVDAVILLDRHPDGTTVSEPESRPLRVRSAFSDIHTSLGAGIRLILPGVAIPALKLDVGYGIDVRSVPFTPSRGLPRTTRTRPIIELLAGRRIGRRGWPLGEGHRILVCENGMCDTLFPKGVACHEKSA
jgi:hypothetical protein